MAVVTQLNKAKEFLSSSFNDGWLPYALTRGKTASIEATAWSSIALMSSHPDLAAKGITFILNNQNADGGWSTTPGIGQSDWNSALAVLALRFAKFFQPQLIDEKSLNKALKEGFHYLIISRMDLMIPVLRLLLLMGAKGKEGLQFGRGWPWCKGCYSWVEPTAYSLMALKFPHSIEDDHLTKMAIAHADKFLLEHACKGGGWNHGAFYCLGEYTPPYILTTAETLVSLIDLPKNEKITEALHYLENVHYQAPSAWSLAWNILALDAYRYDCSHNINLLLSLQNKNGSFGSNFLSTALSILALSTTDGTNPFRIKEKSK